MMNINYMIRKNVLFSLLRGPVCRLHTSPHLAAVDKASLSKLRKKTGITFINCKKALEKFDNNLEKAEAWLKDQAQKEGWTKASKLENRSMSQGLISLLVNNNAGVIVEVNCETDFVARNDKFQKFVTTITQACMKHGQQADTGKLLLDTEAVKSVSVESNQGTRSLTDMVAMEIGNIGENMRVRRAVYVQTQDAQKLGTYVHSSGERQLKDGQCRFGKYGSLIVFSQREASREQQLSSALLGSQLAQHIVGMNPKSLGTMEDDTETETETESESGDCQEKEADSQLLQQEFLLDSDINVKDFLNMNSAQVLDFVRFECGEKLGKDENEQ